jgi:hypothetical protein
MDSTFDLFDYPHSPGHGRGRFTVTSAKGAETIAPVAPTLRNRCLALVREAPNGITAGEAAKALEWDLCSVRPRFTELLRMHKVRDSGDRRKSRTRCPEIVWKLAPEDGAPPVRS